MASTSSAGGFQCRHCKAVGFESLTSLEWHQAQSCACRIVRAMAAAAANQPPTPQPPVRFDDIHIPAPNGPFYDDLPDLPDDDVEDPAIVVESDEDEGDAGLGAQGAAPAVGDKRPRFDSARETLLWFNTAGPGKTRISNRGRDEWLKLMKDERYRLEEVLGQWKSHRDMEKTLMKAAVGEVSPTATATEAQSTGGAGRASGALITATVCSLSLDLNFSCIKYCLQNGQVATLFVGIAVY